MRFAFIFGAFLLLGGCATVPRSGAAVPDKNQLTWLVPFENWRDIAGKCIPGQTCWSNLSRAEANGRLGVSVGETVVYRRDREGSLSLVPSKVTTSKGEYRVVQYVAQYANVPCNASDSAAGFYRLGIGVKVEADITTKKSGISLSDFIPISVAANRNQVNGSLRITGWGINSKNSVLSSYFNYGGQVENPDAVSKAIESMAVARAVMANDDTKFLPQVFAMQEIKPGACSAIKNLTQPAA